MKGSLNMLYSVLGISKQAVQQYHHRQMVFNSKISDLLIEVDELRAEHPGCGVEKMYYTLNPDFIGRDRFVETFMELGYRIKRIKNYHRTTIPVASKYSNLIEGLVVKKKNTVWQSDITYYQLNERFYYIVFILDVFTRQIVGYAVSDSLRAESNIRALKMAIRDHGSPKIHHSDRGSQYIEKQYVKLLMENGVMVSMGLQAQDNAYAERINGTIKNNYLKHWQIITYADLKTKVKRAVNHYNIKRIHDSLPERLTPNKFEKVKFNVIEEIFAPRRPDSRRDNFQRNKLEKENKNELYCLIN